MKRKWQVRRQFQPCPNAAERWDHAYQCLLRWTAQPESTVANDIWSAPEQEANHAHSRLCTRLDSASSPEPNH
jgi:hypothetical protein